MGPDSPTADEIKKELANHRRLRTRRRNQVKKDIAKVENLDSANPTFPETIDPNALLIAIATYECKIREYDTIIAKLIADEEEQANEIDEAEDFSIFIGDAVSRIKAAMLRSQLEAESTFYATPEAVRHVHFGRPTSSTPFPRAAGAHALDVTQATIPGTAGILRHTATPAADRRNDTAQPAPHQTADHTAAASQPTTADSPVSIAQIPKELDISPEAFRGERLKYRAFITQFKCFVAKRPHASPVEKLMTLRKYLRDQPKELVEALELEDHNYQVALDLLEDTYAEVTTGTERLLSELRVLPPIPRYYDLQALQRVITRIQRNCASLAANKIPIEVYAMALENAIDAAMPTRLRHELSEHQHLEGKLSAFRHTSDVTADDIQTTLAERIAAETKETIREANDFTDAARENLSRADMQLADGGQTALRDP